MLPPRVEFKPIEGNTLAADTHLADERANLGIEAISVDAKVLRCIAQSENARDDMRSH